MTRVSREVLCAYSVKYTAVITPTGTTKIVIKITRMVVPTIMGKIPVVAGSNTSFLGIVETKCQDKPGQPWITTLISTTASRAIMR